MTPSDTRPSYPPGVPDPWCTADRHGDRQAYAYQGCRCDTARRDAALRNNQYKLTVAASGPHLVPILGTSRRLRALAAAGWPLMRVVETMPTIPAASHARAWARGGRPSIQRATALAVAKVYLDLESTPGPSVVAARMAQQKHWLGPERWFGLDMDDPQVRPLRLHGVQHPVELDEVVVSRLLAGFHPQANRHERREATRALWAVGLTTSQIARRLDVDDRQVSRDVAWLRERGLAESRPH